VLKQLRRRRGRAGRRASAGQGECGRFPGSPNRTPRPRPRPPTLPRFKFTTGPRTAIVVMPIFTAFWFVSEKQVMMCNAKRDNK
jgi:hypothetical protein